MEAEDCQDAAAREGKKQTNKKPSIPKFLSQSLIFHVLKASGEVGRLGATWYLDNLATPPRTVTVAN